MLLADVAPRAEGADRKLIEHALRVLADDDVLEAAKHDAALGPGALRGGRAQRRAPRPDASSSRR